MLLLVIAFIAMVVYAAGVFPRTLGLMSDRWLTEHRASRAL